MQQQKGITMNTNTIKIFNVDNVEQEAKRICDALQKVAPWVITKVSTLGGAEHVSIIIHVSLDEKNTWVNGYVDNSCRFMIDFTCNGVLNQFIKERALPNFRKRTVKNVDEAITKLTDYINVAKQSRIKQ